MVRSSRSAKRRPLPRGIALHVCRAPRRAGAQARQLGHLLSAGKKADRRAAAARQVGRDPPRRRSPEAVPARTARHVTPPPSILAVVLRPPFDQRGNPGRPARLQRRRLPTGFWLGIPPNESLSVLLKGKSRKEGARLQLTSQTPEVRRLDGSLGPNRRQSHPLILRAG